MNPSLDYYAQQGILSDPREYAYLFTSLPNTLPEMVRVVQGLTVHVFWAERYGLKLSPEREAEVQLRTMPNRLVRTLELDPAPLNQARPLERRLVGNCRDFTLLLVSILRHQGIPARARCGFGAYFLPGHYEDHWVAETWDSGQGRWILVDAQLDSFQCDVLKISFNPLDVPRDQFIVGGKAWQMCRSGQADPEAFGIFDMRGLGFVRGDLVRDVAALNKVELLPWDCWGIIEKESLDDSADLEMLDRLAALTAGDVPDFEAVQAFYASDARLRMDGTVHSHTGNGIETIRIE
jgi:hypothetical protein